MKKKKKKKKKKNILIKKYKNKMANTEFKIYNNF